MKKILAPFFVFCASMLLLSSYSLACADGACEELDTRLSNADYISPETVEGAKLVTTEEAYALWEKRAVFVDTRSTKAFELGRIPGAISLPYEPGAESAQPFTAESLAEVAEKDEPLVCYCNGLKCDRAPWCASLALEWGYTDVYYYREGFPAWAEAGHSVE